ncbi:hypothetical protein BJ912DRAFT_864156 [Pholiota molesta]|nr:hypothetical protein BJ912DRAFT_864156 [Pholiota molesta]
MANRWISDLINDIDGSLTVSTHNARSNNPHSPPDDIKLPVCMTEAMDDSLLITLTLPAMQKAALHADQFQVTYGWESEWRKSMFYAYRAPDFPSNQTDLRISIPSVNYANPSSSEVFQNSVPVTTNHTTFLRVPINKPDAHFAHLQDIITNFSFPLLSRPLPITALRQILSQSLVAKIRPLLAFQTITRDHAAKLDHMLAHKIHAYLGMPFHFNSTTLSSPLSNWGLNFPSITRLNDSLAVTGLQCDLNHTIPTFHNMANITLADWSCQLNHCHSPLSLPRQGCTFLRSKHLLPYSWIHAHHVLHHLNLSFCSTDLSFITSANISLIHLHNILSPLKQNPNSPPSISRAILSHFHAAGISFLHQLGQWNLSTSLTLSFNVYNLAFPYYYTLSREWPILFSWLQSLPQSLLTLAYPSIHLLLPRNLRQNLAEKAIYRLYFSCQAFPHPAPSHLFSSDASHISKHDTSSVTTAVVGNHNGFVASLNSFGQHASILQGETYGILVSTLLAHRLVTESHHHRFKPSILTDHLNSVRLLNTFLHPNSSPPLSSLNSNPAHNCDVFQHVRAHTNSTTLPSCLNHLADHIASQSQTFLAPPPSLPVPTFTMDPFTPYDENNGFIEANLNNFINNALVQKTPTCLPPLIGHKCLYDSLLPPEYPYTRAVSAFSASIQLYSRSQQLDCAHTLSTRLKGDVQPWCRFGCPNFETSHHIFSTCPRFTQLRINATGQLRTTTETTLETFHTNFDHLTDLAELIDGLFLKPCSWPTSQIFYYFGIIPKINLEPHNLPHLSNIQLQRMHQHISNDFHSIAIKLAGRIWGIVRRTFSPFQSSPKSPTVLTLPSHLSHITTSSTRLSIKHNI